MIFRPQLVSPGVLRSVLPKLNQSGWKGQCGRVAVIGGSYEFTGAPYYSAIAALKAGCDLTHIFCSRSSAVAIKGYSPECIVHPLFVSEEEEPCSLARENELHVEWLKKIKSWEKAIGSWVIGPGLGRDRLMASFFPKLIQALPTDSVVVLDADALFHLCQSPHLFNELSRFKAILTPNWREYTHLSKFINEEAGTEIIAQYQIAVNEFWLQQNQAESKSQILQGMKDNIQSQTETPTKQNSEIGRNTIHDPPEVKMAHPHLLQFGREQATKSRLTVMLKGPHDLIMSPGSVFSVATHGSLKRCGGMGDVLAGMTAVFATWDYQRGPALASHLCRLAAHAAYLKEGRSMTAPNVIRQLSGIILNYEQSYN